MIFWLFVIILTIGVGLYISGIVFDNAYYTKTKMGPIKSLYRNGEIIKCVGGAISILSGLIILLFVICLCTNYIGIEARLAQSREDYKALVYKTESESCRDEFGILNKALVDEIQAWNKSVVYHQEIQKDFWVGIFIPNVYDEFETIDYKNFK